MVLACCFWVRYPADVEGLHQRRTRAALEAIVHNTKQLRCGRVLDRFGEIVGRLAGMVDRFTTTLDCLDVGYLPADTLDQLPLPSQLGRTRVGDIDLNKPRIRAALTAVLALTAAPGGFTVKDLAITGLNSGVCGSMTRSVRPSGGSSPRSRTPRPRS